MKTKHAVLCLALMLAATVCVAGTAWHYKCDNPKCGFSGNLDVGGGFIFDQVTGYCSTCKKFVSIRWKAKDVSPKWKERRDKDKTLSESAPQKLGAVWNPSTGLMADLFPCPECKQPFMAVDDISLRTGATHEMGGKFCPKCGKLSLRFEIRGNYD